MQIFDYETKYLESCNPAGSALKGEQCMHQWQGTSVLLDSLHHIPFCGVPCRPHHCPGKALLQHLCLATCKTLPCSVAEPSAHCLQFCCWVMWPFSCTMLQAVVAAASTQVHRLGCRLCRPADASWRQAEKPKLEVQVSTSGKGVLWVVPDRHSAELPAVWAAGA